MTEREFTGRIITMAQSRGFLVHHCSDSRKCTGTPGFPDLVIINPMTGRMIFVELKMDGVLDSGQKRWRWALLAGFQEWYCWRPADWEDQTIAVRLNALAGE